MSISKEMQDALLAQSIRANDLKEMNLNFDRNTLRDKFAIAALQGNLISDIRGNGHYGEYRDFLTGWASLCYEMADAMMEARKK